MIRTNNAKWWRVAWTSVAGIKAAAIVRTSDILGRRVRGLFARYRANPERVKNAPISIFFLVCVQQRHVYGDASVIVLWYIFLNSKLELVVIQGPSTPGGIFNSSTIRPPFDSHPLRDQPPSCIMDNITANNKDLIRREAVQLLDQSSRRADLIWSKTIE